MQRQPIQHSVSKRRQAQAILISLTATLLLAACSPAAPDSTPVPAPTPIATVNLVPTPTPTQPPTEIETETETTTLAPLDALQLTLPAAWSVQRLNSQALAALLSAAPASTTEEPALEPAALLKNALAPDSSMLVATLDGGEQGRTLLQAIGLPRNGLYLEDYLRDAHQRLQANEQLLDLDVRLDSELRDDGVPVGIIHFSSLRGEGTETTYQIVQIDGEGELIWLLTFVTATTNFDMQLPEFQRIAAGAQFNIAR